MVLDLCFWWSKWKSNLIFSRFECIFVCVFVCATNRAPSADNNHCCKQKKIYCIQPNMQTFPFLVRYIHIFKRESDVIIFVVVWSLAFVTALINFSFHLRLLSFGKSCSIATVSTWVRFIPIILLQVFFLSVF